MNSARLLLWALSNGVISQANAEIFLEGAFANDPGHDELLVLNEIVKNFDIAGYEWLYDAYDEVVTAHLIASVEDEFPDAEVFSGSSSQSTARRRFIELMDEKAGELGAYDSSSVADSVAGDVDVDRFYDKYFSETEREPDYEARRGRPMSLTEALPKIIDPIDDLFART
ncbi:hypothetical protein [Pseudomonas sp. SG-MS2]|uniref:hypothetical protein n=1 Tax=Pseudomonas sp. SG-MS2 TaxID=1914534 RepID=UPI001379A309|nr:hypothetical protein [Pseudomonas sp. SG-MS2]